MERAGFLALRQKGAERTCTGGVSTPFFFSSISSNPSLILG